MTANKVMQKISVIATDMAENMQNTTSSGENSLLWPKISPHHIARLKFLRIFAVLKPTWCP